MHENQLARSDLTDYQRLVLHVHAALVGAGLNVDPLFQEAVAHVLKQTANTAHEDLTGDAQNDQP